jgi:hypothetical protein
MFILLLSLSALLVAGSAAYFSVLGIATLFSGSYYEVMIMAGSLEFGKLIATSYLYRYWEQTNRLLKSYLIIAVVILMGITSMGIFGYLSAAYQTNSSNFAQIDSKIALLEEQKSSFDKEIDQNNARLDTLNKSRASQEQRLPGLSSRAAQPIYKDIEKAGEEIQKLTDRAALLQENKTEKDNEIIALQTEISKAKDIGTFKFVADSINKPIDVVVTMFICVLIMVFDPLAVALILAFNVAVKKPTKIIVYDEPEEPEVIENNEGVVPKKSTEKKSFKLSSVIANGTIKKS